MIIALSGEQAPSKGVPTSFGRAEVKTDPLAGDVFVDQL